MSHFALRTRLNVTKRLLIPYVKGCVSSFYIRRMTLNQQVDT